MSTMTEAMVI